jgi:hypothetical protein
MLYQQTEIIAAHLSVFDLNSGQDADLFVKGEDIMKLSPNKRMHASMNQSVKTSVDQGSPEPYINFKPDRTNNELRLAAKECSDAKPKEMSPSPIKSIK